MENNVKISGLPSAGTGNTCSPAAVTRTIKAQSLSHLSAIGRLYIIRQKSDVDHLLSNSPYQDELVLFFPHNIACKTEELASIFHSAMVPTIKGILIEDGSSLMSHHNRTIFLNKLGLRALLVRIPVDSIDQNLSNVLVVINGEKGLVIINPATEVMDRERERTTRINRVIQSTTLSFRPGFKTADDKLIIPAAVVNDIGELPRVRNSLSPSYPDFPIIGLIRTEFYSHLFNDWGGYYHGHPSDFSLACKYRPDLFDGFQEVTFRTLDIGGDKSLSYVSIPPGMRGIELLLTPNCEEPRQLILRQLFVLMLLYAKADSIQHTFPTRSFTPRIIFPLVKNAQDFSLAMQLIQEAAIGIGRVATSGIVWGAMIEHPDAVANIPEMERQAYFSCMSLGTNDLTTYITDKPRGEVGCDPLDPRVIKLIHQAKQKARKEMSSCGDMANEWRGFLLLVGMGLRKIAFSPTAVFLARALAAKVTTGFCKELLKTTLNMSTPQQVREHIDREVRRLPLGELGEILFQD